MLDPIIILLALVAGLAVRKIQLPPMLGYLVAGFVVSGIGIETGNFINQLAHAGVTLLLFTIGLKLNIRELATFRVWGVASSHMLISAALFGGLLFLAAPLLVDYYNLSSEAVWTIAFALSFSSTVLAVKVFEGRGEGASMHAKIAIGILVMQDFVAVIYLTLSTGKVPDISALYLLLLLPLRPMLLKLLKSSGHGELIILFGITLAFGGYALFESVGLKGDLGALLVGVLLSNHKKSSELSKSLLDLKDLFLVGFFLSIGLYGIPQASMLVLALVLALISVIKPMLFFILFTGCRLRARTALLGAFSLSSYSEFGLIVAAIAAANGIISNDWVVILALALAISFFIAVPMNTKSHWFYNRFKQLLYRFERIKRLPEEEPVTLGAATVVVLGMGRVGGGAYEYLTKQYGDKVVGVEENTNKVRSMQEKGINVIHGDASDRDFWYGPDLDHIKLIMVSLTKHAENLDAVSLLKELNYRGQIAVIARFPDELAELKSQGCVAFDLYAEAGHGFAEHVAESISLSPTNNV